MNQEEHVYTVEITVIGAQPDNIEGACMYAFDADSVHILKEKVFPDLNEG